MPRKRLTVIAYDIERNAIRNRVAGFLEARAVRVQKSVFEARLDVHEARWLAARLEAMILPSDSVRMYTLNDAALRDAIVLGRGLAPTSDDFLLA